MPIIMGVQRVGCRRLAVHCLATCRNMISRNVRWASVAFWNASKIFFSATTSLSCFQSAAVRLCVCVSQAQRVRTPPAKDGRTWSSCQQLSKRCHTRPGRSSARSRTFATAGQMAVRVNVCAPSATEREKGRAAWQAAAGGWARATGVLRTTCVSISSLIALRSVVGRPRTGSWARRASVLLAESLQFTHSCRPVLYYYCTYF